MEKRALLEAFGDRISLPSLPEVVLRITAAIDDPAIGVAEMGRIASEDPAVTARVLRLANSGFYGLSEPVTSAERAVTVIGARALRNVAMQCSIVRHYEHLRAIPDFDRSPRSSRSRSRRPRTRGRGSMPTTCTPAGCSTTSGRS
jgi:HD-like signal output (HDOD) protein